MFDHNGALRRSGIPRLDVSSFSFPLLSAHNLCVVLHLKIIMGLTRYLFTWECLLIPPNQGQLRNPTLSRGVCFAWLPCAGHPAGSGTGV